MKPLDLPEDLTFLAQLHQTIFGLIVSKPRRAVKRCGKE